MSIKRTYPIEPIGIQIDDNAKFSDMAWFFDRPDVIQDIYELRKKWIGDVLIPHNKVDDYTNQYDDKQHWDNFLGCRRLAIKYGVGATFVRPIISAVLSGMIDDTDYQTILVEYQVDNIPLDLQIREKVAYTSPRIVSEDIKQHSDVDNKSISSVKNHRKWYWLYHNMGYRKIAKQEKQPITTITSGIQSYRNKISQLSGVTI